MDAKPSLQYADDTTIYTIANVSQNTRVQDGMDATMVWSQNHNMKFHKEKNKVMLMSFNKETSKVSNIAANGVC